MDMASISIYASGMTTTDLAGEPEAKPMHPRRAATRARICEAANQLFFERGFPLVTMEQIAAAADIQRSTLYLHFREKDEILAAIAEDYTAKVRAVVAQLPGPVPSLEEIAGLGRGLRRARRRGARLDRAAGDAQPPAQRARRQRWPLAKRSRP